MFNSYVDKSPDIDHALLQQYMDDETWFTAKEAKDLGLIDNVTKSFKSSSCCHTDNVRGETFMKRYRSEEPQQPQEPKKQGEEITVEDVMDKLEEILAEVKKGLRRQQITKEPKEPKQNRITNHTKQFCKTI
ncbi:ATP-dependent Clp protease proteolytic subunit [Staphylococcus pseudoxylosus]|uniref:ATP-dependent Clp protease proteolytic subunit n=1 Tax=Staphylococcus pseudoxylosus TaxID=2282419 RepID=UPI00398B5F44